MRDEFRRLFVANKKEHKSGAGAEETDEAADVTWPYFEQLMFLKDSIEGRPSVVGINFVTFYNQVFIGEPQFRQWCSVYETCIVQSSTTSTLFLSTNKK